MDDTSQSRTSDVAANAATRKQRSSILKSQRPPRTPFCDLEFNLCTPMDTSKSRRVSFSKRTGVAEFDTNEATTTWKNFYEEQNKSPESPGNESAVNHGKQPVAHLGKRIFDQQFEEVEAVDFMGTVNPGINITSSINSINFAQLECTETKLTGPQGNFELSAMTETQSRLFGDNLGITCAGETSARIDVNFSTIDQIGEKDDLDEIQKDLQRQSNIVCPGPFAGQNISEYIEIDLNESNMSITDTISSPKVQDVSKSCSIDKKISIGNKDWVADKENIVLNPYDPVTKSPESPKRSQHRSPPRRTKSKRPGSSLTVQRLMTTVAMAPDRDPARDGVESSTSEPRSACGSRDVLDPATSSDVVSSLGRSSLASAASAADWAPTASHSLIYEPDAGDDILARINAMPVMGSSECRLESAAGCEWRLLLLNERLRLTLRFSCEPRHPDAPLLAVRLDALHLHADTTNSIAYLCVQFCEEMMQHFVARGCGAARDVPRLVRQLGGCAQLAAQWARVMYAARLRLAYSLAHDGHLALKVANKWLRTVWEVTMRLQMSSGAGSAMAGGAPWPCAGAVRVTRVLPAPPAALDVSRALAGTPHDWGHAPHTIWKVFRFLKHKKREDDAIPIIFVSYHGD